MKHRYRPSVAGIVIALYGAYFLTLAYRWAMDGQTTDGAGAVVVAVLLGWVAWRVDTRVLS